MTGSHELARRVLDRCKALGFALAGICDARPTDYKQELLDWLAGGKHGEMEYLNRNIELRVDPSALVPGAKSVICVADRYHDGSSEPEQSSSSPHHPPAGERPIGRIARYARGDDYHDVMRKRLTKLARELSGEFPGETFRACVDTAPVLERELAQRAGLGAIGKNTLLLERGVGSYLLLGEIITTLPLAASPPSEPDPCGSCTRCIDACPTQAISPWSVDATRCISYLTIEHRGEIDERFHTAMGDWIFGCDVCQEVCPHNQPTQRSQARASEVLPAYAPRRAGFDLLEVLNWDEQARQGAFIKSAMKRAKLGMMKRNVIIAAGNAMQCGERSPLRERIESIGADPTEEASVTAAVRAMVGLR